MTDLGTNIRIEPAHQKFTALQAVQDKLHHFIGEHSRLISAAAALTTVGGAIAGSAALPALGVGALCVVGYRWSHALTYIFGQSYIKPTNEMKNHVFTERTCTVDGQIRGKLFYEGDTPVLQFFTSDPYEMGYIEGYLLGDKIQELTEDVLEPMITTCKVLVGDFSGKVLKEGLGRVEVPKKFLPLFNGLYDGMKKYCEAKGKPIRSSFNDIILAHSFPDIYKSIGCQKLYGVKTWNTIGCSTFVRRNEDGMEVARTVDWPAFIKGGRQMYLRRYQTENGTQVEAQTLPGMMHSLTARNSHGVVTVINELGTVSIGKTPYGLVARDIIENADSAEAGVALMRKKLEAKEPASSHLLLIADQKTAVTFQVYAQKENNTYKSPERRLLEGAGQSMWHTNHALDAAGQPIPGTEADDTSHKRFELVRQNKDKTSEEILKSVNVLDTIATAVYTIKGKTVTAKYTHGSTYAAVAL